MVKVLKRVFDLHRATKEFLCQTGKWNVRIYSAQMRNWINLHIWRTWIAGQAVCSFAGQHLYIINLYGEIKCFQVTLMLSMIQPNTTMPYMFPANTHYNLQQFFHQTCSHLIELTLHV